MARRLAPRLLVLLSASALAALAVTRHREVAAAADRVGVVALLAATLLHVAMLACRSEAWRASLLAAGGAGPGPARRDVHAASAAAYGFGALQAYGAPPMRITMLRSLSGERAPSVTQMALCDAPVLLLEGLVAATILALGLVGEGRAPWIALAPLAGVVAGLLAILGARGRLARTPVLQGLDVLRDRRYGPLLALQVAIMAALTLVRLLVLLEAAGAPHAPERVAVVFSTLGALSLLPLGPTASPAATLAVTGDAGAGTALVAGLAIAATSVLAVGVYAALILGWAGLRRASRGVDGAAADRAG
jgi:hypothetical protein